MKKKMFLRGLGLGILVTALVLTITGSSKMSDEEIIKRAEKLGYAKQESDVSPTISLKDLMGTGTPTPTQTPTVMPSEAPLETQEPTETISPTETPVPALTATVTPAPTEIPTPAPTTTPIPVVTDKPESSVVTATIVIERGNTATVVCNKMQEAGIVESGEEFKKYLVQYNLTDYINVGSYTLSSDMSYKEMAKLLTGR